MSLDVAALDGFEAALKARHARELAAVAEVRRMLGGRIWDGLAGVGTEAEFTAKDAKNAKGSRPARTATVGAPRTVGTKPVTWFARRWIADQKGQTWALSDLFEGSARTSGLALGTVRGRLYTFVKYLKERGQLEAVDQAVGKGRYRAPAAFSLEEKRGGTRKGEEAMNDRWALRNQIAAEVAAKKGAEAE